MGQSQDPERRTSRARDVIAAFLKDELESRLKKLTAEDSKRDALIARFQSDTWIESASIRVQQIQAVTHSVKAVHPKARGTSLYVDPTTMLPTSLVGSHVLGSSFISDIVGNAAVLDVYKFLKLEVDGRSLLSWLVADDQATLRALSDDEVKGRKWQLAFVGLMRDRDEAPTSHALAKQTYWLIGDDAADDEQYHLLAPLFATSLAQTVHGVLQEDRYGDANKAARAARRSNSAHEGVLHDYPALAVRKLGGTNTQNVSQLNAERGGVNYLLGSLPPSWDQNVPRHLWGVTSVFGSVFNHYGRVRPITRSMLRFLQRDPPPNMETRNRVDAYVGGLIDEMVSMAGEFQRGLPRGWTADSRCKLEPEERLWLDPWRAEQEGEFRSRWLFMDWPAQIGHRFGNWLNTRLESRFKLVGDIEHRRWQRELLVDEDVGGWAWQLRQLRTDLKASHYIAARGGAV
ncbi:MAG TPA: type I-F CRISPR-associated protein Csy1 [Castellaniella sp.]|uniref:type I-F CRISPR-associated protein Csy1 n=1 Tax=Castellaniella sp. TaxID=1955812 RepID=UPI002EF3D5EA